MLRAVTKSLTYSSRTQKDSKIDFDILSQKRRFLLEKIAPLYSQSDRPHEDRVYEEVLYGRKCNIVGLTPNSQLSATYIRSICLGLNPDHVILGGFNNSRLISDRIARTVQQKRSVRGYDTFIQPSKMFCKALVSPMITKIVEQDPNIYVDDDRQTVYVFDHDNKHVHASNYITIMNRIMYHQFSKLSFGMPSDYIVFEDLMINQSLETLRGVFDRVVEVTRQNKDKYGIQRTSISYYPQLILEQMRYNAVFQPILTQKQLTYTTALLNKSVATSQRVMLFVQNHYLEQIADNVHKIKIDPKQVYRGGCTNVADFIKNSNSEAGLKLNSYLYAENKDQSINQLIQKMIILNQLKNNTLEKELLEDGQNIFNKTVFAQLFDKLTIQEIKERYRKIKGGYAEAIGGIIQKRVNEAITFKEPQKNFYTLTQMIKTQEQRNLDFPVQLKVINYETIKQQRIDFYEISQEIQRMIKKELSSTDKELIQAYFNGQLTRQNIVLYQKLLVQAKLRLKKTNIKLPIHHYSALSGIFKDQIKNSILYKGQKKSEQQVLMERIEALKSKGKIRQIESQEELNELVGLDSPRIALSVNENGELAFHEDGNTVESVQKMMKNNEFLKQMFERGESSKDEEDVYEEKDQVEAKTPPKPKQKSLKSKFRRK